jgi:hypothetical protein
VVLFIYKYYICEIDEDGEQKIEVVSMQTVGDHEQTVGDHKQTDGGQKHTDKDQELIVEGQVKARQM